MLYILIKISDKCPARTSIFRLIANGVECPHSTQKPSEINLRAFDMVGLTVHISNHFLSDLRLNQFKIAANVCKLLNKWFDFSPVGG